MSVYAILSLFKSLSWKQLLKLEMIYLKLLDIIGESHKWILLNTFTS